MCKSCHNIVTMQPLHESYPPMHIDELAAGILQITHRGTWDHFTWNRMRNGIEEYLGSHDGTVYVLLNFIGATRVDPEAFRELVTAPQFGLSRVGLAIMVGRRAQLHQARALVENDPQARANAKLRLMGRIDDAFSALLDRQVIDRINGVTRYGG
jgi:hypothetical protein